ncbi:MAG: PTS transporter subunit EIIC [Brevinema sp.]
MSVDLNQISAAITDAVGGVKNIKAMEHCATRLRLMLHNEELINSDALQNIPNAKGYFFQAGQHQIIFGGGLVNKVYAKMTEQGVESDGKIKDAVYENLSPSQKFARIFGDVFIPIIPVIVVTGLFMGLRGLVQSMGLELTPQFMLLSGILTDTAFIFLPVFITWSAFQKFGGNAALGILTGLILISPALPNAWAVAGGSAEPLVLALFGLKINLVGFQGSIITPLFISWLACMVEKKARQIIPDILAMLLVPLVVISFVVVVGLIILSPLLHTIEYAIADLITGFVTLPFGIGGIIIGFTQQALVITGLHHIFAGIEATLLNTLGYSPVSAIVSAAMGGMVGAGFAVRNTKTTAKEKSESLALIVPAFLGITEPLLFGLTLPNPRVFFAGMLGGAVGGFIAGLMQLKAQGFGVTFIPGLSLYIGSIDMLWYIMICAVSIFAGLIFGTIALKTEKKS